MELTTTVKCDTRVSATLEEDGRFSVNVFAAAEYAKGRTTTAQVAGHELDPEKVAAAAAALQALQEDAAAKLGPRLNRAIHKSAEVSAAHGEI